MVLSDRLALIYSMIPPCDILCDIGTDHALLPAYAILNKRCKRAIACDVGKGPLNRAKRTVERYFLQDRIELRLGDGLEPISGDEADVLVLAGMGGVLMTELLQKGIEKAKQAQRILLQPMYTHEVVRPFLWDNGFSVADESLAREGDKLYQVLSVIPRPDDMAQKTDLYAVVGEKLVLKGDPLLKDWLERLIQRQKKIVTGLKSARQPGPILEKEEALLKDMLELMNQI